MEHIGKEEQLPISPTTTFFAFPKKMVLYFFHFLAVGKKVEEQRNIVREDVGCVGVTRPAL
jgi:hypothetical protein